MDFDIYFCKDGILRAKYSDKYPMIPLNFIQQNLKQKDLSFWSRWWESNVYFEDGLTVGKFLICLEPWAEFWGDMTLKNVSAYIAEVRKPYDISKEKEKPLSWIGISYYTELDTSVEYKKDDDARYALKRLSEAGSGRAILELLFPVAIYGTGVKTVFTNIKKSEKQKPA